MSRVTCAVAVADQELLLFLRHGHGHGHAAATAAPDTSNGSDVKKALEEEANAMNQLKVIVRSDRAPTLRQAPSTTTNF